MDEIIVLTIYQICKHKAIKGVLTESIYKTSSLAKVLSILETTDILEGYKFAYPISTKRDILFCFKKL